MKTTLTNRAVAELLERHGELLEIAGESPFRTRAYSRAAEGIRSVSVPLNDLIVQGRLRDIPGVGEGIASAVAQLLETGRFSAHDELTRQIPESLVELTTIPGVGAKTALKLFTSLGVYNLETLEAAINANSVATTKGLGSRTDAVIREGLAALRRRTGRFPLGSVLPLGRAVAAAFANLRPQDRISLAGSARRWDVTVQDLDFVVGSDDFPAAIAAITDLAMVASARHISATKIELDLGGGIKGDVVLTMPSSWGAALVRATGNARHVERLGRWPEEASTEEEIYRANGLPWIPPELRGGDQEFDNWPEIPELVELKDINGEFHTHTTWSDGTASIEDMARAAAKRGYTFLGITDHSHGLGVAGGLDVERLARQRLELAAADNTEPVRLLAGAEVEVHRDGELDFDDAILASLDVVVASLHTGLRQPREELTDRLIRVLRNPNVDIIAHPSGRLLERRESGDFDWDRAFGSAAQTGTALEINADPARLDLDPHLAQKASEGGCLISINCDAHRPDGFQVMEYGVAMARRAWLTPDKILNCWPRERIQQWLSARGKMGPS
jgi:DNA polymerase (family 10)